MSAAQARVPVEERLFSLVLALLATDAGLTKNEILSTVQGYRQRYSTSGRQREPRQRSSSATKTTSVTSGFRSRPSTRLGSPATTRTCGIASLVVST